MTLRFILAGLLIWQFSASAQAAPWYQVEVMLVAYTDEAKIDNETWPKFLPPLEVQAQSPDFRWWLTPSINRHNALMANYGFSKTPNASWQQPMQPLESLELQDAAERISQRTDMKILWHKAWIEPVQEQEAAILHPINIELEDKFDLSLTGSFSLYLSRYLHFNTNLTMQHSLKGELEEAAELHTALDNKVTALTHENALNTEEFLEDSLADGLEHGLEGLDNTITLDGTAMADTVEAEAEPTYKLIPLRAAHIELQRRMRSKELHYIDHPMLGVIVRVNPILD